MATTSESRRWMSLNDHAVGGGEGWKQNRKKVCENTTTCFFCRRSHLSLSPAGGAFFVFHRLRNASRVCAYMCVCVCMLWLCPRGGEKYSTAGAPTGAKDSNMGAPNAGEAVTNHYSRVLGLFGATTTATKAAKAGAAAAAAAASHPDQQEKNAAAGAGASASDRKGSTALHRSNRWGAVQPPQLNPAFFLALKAHGLAAWVTLKKRLVSFNP
jgi:hypothetical protein